MRRATTLWPVIPALALTACAGSTPSVDVEAIRLAAPDAAVLAPCARPGRIPATATTQAAQEALWRRDRIALAACASRHAAAADWIRAHVAALTEN